LGFSVAPEKRKIVTEKLENVETNNGHIISIVRGKQWMGKQS
jgi:hypothetical protein